MPLVKPDFGSARADNRQLTNGRYVVKISDARESEKLDKNGYNALVVKLEVVNNAVFNGRKISRWLPLGGAGAKVLYTFLKALNPAYKGEPFHTEALVGKLLEVDVSMEQNPKDGKTWAKVDRVYQYLQPGSVGTTLKSNAAGTGNFDDFDSFDA